MATRKTPPTTPMPANSAGGGDDGAQSAPSGFSIDDAAQPPTEEPTSASGRATSSGPGPTCRTCGEPVTWSGTGRKPILCDRHRKESEDRHGRHESADRPPSGPGPSRRTTADVAAAVAILSSLYDAGALGLMLASPAGARKWSAAVPGLLQTDAVILAADKQLCQAILRMGETNGRTVFVMAHLMALVPVALEVRADFADRRAARQAEQATPASNGHFPDDASSLTGDGGFPNERFFG